MDSFTARDVPMWRRELIDWYREQGADWYHTMIMMGRQHIRPAGPPREVAQWLSDRERHCLTDASLWYVDQDTCDLVNDAHGSMPPFAPVPSDLPSRTGFAMFHSPVLLRDPIEENGIREIIGKLSLLDANADEYTIIARVNELVQRTGEEPKTVIAAIAQAESMGDPQRAEMIRNRLSRLCNVELHGLHTSLITQTIKIMGVSWSAAPSGTNPPRFPAGGVWMSFYSASNLEEVIREPELLARCRRLVLGLMVDNEAVVPWYPGEGDREPFLLPTDTPTTYGWARLMFATFRLAAQRGLIEQIQHRTERPERRRTQRAQLPERDVTVLRLRRSERADGLVPAVGTKHGHRYPVRGHWRNQWYPSVEDHRPIYIEQHIRGPEGTVFRGGERVIVV